MSYNEEKTEKLFPNLKSTDFKITSPYDAKYNCIAWVIGDKSSWWEPDPLYLYRWPREIPRNYSISAYRAMLEQKGYPEISNEKFEPKFQKVALYVKDNIPTHASRQLDNGKWTSKLGKNIDIEHTLEGLVGEIYGNIEVILKRTK